MPSAWSPRAGNYLQPEFEHAFSLRLSQTVLKSKCSGVATSILHTRLINRRSKLLKRQRPKHEPAYAGTATRNWPGRAKAEFKLIAVNQSSKAVHFGKF